MTSAFRVVGAPSGFGKLPSRPDFVQVGAASELFARFDRWLTDSVEWAHARGGAAFRDAFRAGTMRAFMYRDGRAAVEQALVVGALAPSQDQAGRLFPMCVGMPVIASEAFAQNPHLLPFACESIWQAAGQTLAKLVSQPDVDLSTCVARLGEPATVSFDDTAAAYAAWGESLQLSELAALMFGAPQGHAFSGVLRLMIEALQPYRNQESPRTLLSLRLPLGSAGGAAVCFWLDAVRRLARWRATVPSVFWSQDGDSGSLILNLGVAPAATVSELWLPATRSDEFCDLAQPLAVATVQALPPLPSGVEQVLGEPAGSVASLLAALAAS
ncbi:MAG: type VI secretion system-associated protein TagF [Pseudomonadota bacterium]